MISLRKQEALDKFRAQLREMHAAMNKAQRDKFYQDARSTLPLDILNALSRISVSVDELRELVEEIWYPRIQ